MTEQDILNRIKESADSIEIPESLNPKQIEIKLEELISEMNISKNKLCHLSQMERSQINKYVNKSITRLDTAVLCRLCYALDCKLSDLLEYIPPEDK